MIDPEAIFEVNHLFHFQDGRTVLTGVFDRDPEKMVRLGRFGFWIDGECVGIIVIEGEAIVSGRNTEARRRRIRSLSTTEPIRFNWSDLAGKHLALKPITNSSKGNPLMHRHLLGIESPPSDYVPDSMTLGPVLPEGWDGDSWEKAGGGRGYFLRAWNKGSGRIAIGQADTYEEARRRLMGDISAGTRSVSISLQQAQPA